MCLHNIQSAAPITPPPTTLPPGMATPMAPPSDPNVPSLPGGMPTNPGIQTDQTPQPASISAPSKMGRALQLLTGGAYDPTGGVDTGTAPNASGQMQPTKFGALMKIIGPMMQGAAVGGFMGKSTPGGGFAAANNMFMQRRMMQMQQSQYLINLMKLQSEVQKNQAEAQWNQRRPMVTRTAPAIKGYDDSGKPVFMSQDPQSGDFRPVEGIHPGGGNTKEINTDKGIVTYDPENPRAGALPLTIGGGPTVGSAADAKNDITAGTAASASEPSERTQGGVPRGMFGGQPHQPTPGKYALSSPTLPAPTGAPSQSPGAIAQGGGVPLHAPGFGKPKPVKVTNRNATGQETDNLVDENPDSPTYGQPVKKGVASRAPLPDKVENRDKAKEGTDADVENYAGEALKRNGNDPDKAIQFLNNLKTGDPASDKKLQAMMPKIRKSIRDRTKQGKKKLTLSPEDQKAAGVTPSTSSSVEPEEEEENP